MGFDRPTGRLGVVHHGGDAQPISTMICGNFAVSRPSRGGVLELLPPVLLLRPTADDDWLKAILQRMVSESALKRPRSESRERFGLGLRANLDLRDRIPIDLIVAAKSPS
jgi:Cupin